VALRSVQFVRLTKLMTVRKKEFTARKLHIIIDTYWHYVEMNNISADMKRYQYTVDQYLLFLISASVMSVVNKKSESFAFKLKRPH